MIRKSVYIETTIPSYATAIPNSDSVKLLRQVITRNFLGKRAAQIRLIHKPICLGRMRKRRRGSGKEAT
ncbi:MAG: hypothetical protein FWF51_11585 [Chitinivibrionia bacterium]|nr:hypothetical protein [Chitinivibrionia bacterium]